MRFFRVLFRRLDMFFGLVGRPCTGPSRDEVWTWRDHLAAIIGPLTAWDVAAVGNPWPWQEKKPCD